MYSNRIGKKGGHHIRGEGLKFVPEVVSTSLHCGRFATPTVNEHINTLQYF